MKSKVKGPRYHGDVDALKSSSSNFLENERYHTVVERGHALDKTFENGNEGLSVKESSKSYEKLQEASKMPERLQREYVEQVPIVLTISNELVGPGKFSPKRYVTTCYFEPKQVPVWYSETMILNIGSTKKKYFESIYYENKLSPFHWSETMTTRIPDSEEPILINSTIGIPVEKPEFHYISLEPQQIAAANKQ